MMNAEVCEKKKSVPKGTLFFELEKMFIDYWQHPTIHVYQSYLLPAPR